MKKHSLSLLLLAALLPCLAACAKTDYASRLSEVRSDIFCAQTEAFSLTLTCTAREYPYADDGIPCPMTNLAEIVIEPERAPVGTVEVYVRAEDGEWGGEASYRAVYGDYCYSQGLETFPEFSVTLRVKYGDEEHEIAATSVKNERTIPPEKALESAVRAEKETLERMRKNGVFCGELRVRLLRRDKTYYYVGITDENGTVSLLLDAETGEVLARRETAL